MYRTTNIEKMIEEMGRDFSSVIRKYSKWKVESRRRRLSPISPLIQAGARTLQSAIPDLESGAQHKSPNKKQHHDLAIVYSLT
jgi:hypothetical protein